LTHVLTKSFDGRSKHLNVLLVPALADESAQ
jgi:hypothetical protein